jgi:hypothetical protein
MSGANARQLMGALARRDALVQPGFAASSRCSYELVHKVTVASTMLLATVSRDDDGVGMVGPAAIAAGCVSVARRMVESCAFTAGKSIS